MDKADVINLLMGGFVKDKKDYDRVCKLCNAAKLYKQKCPRCGYNDN